MLSFGVCLVFYHPDTDAYENVTQLLQVAPKIIIVDNTPDPLPLPEQLLKDPRIEYLPLHHNHGIAHALNLGCQRLFDAGYAFALTMDQDSVFPVIHTPRILELVEHYSRDYAIIGLEFNTDTDPSSGAIRDITCWLTSGNFLKLSAWKKIGGFRDELFIDYVDIDFDHRLITEGDRIGVLQGFSLTHSIGTPITFSFFGKKRHAMNHAPIRYYYRYRNSTRLTCEAPGFYLPYFAHEIFINIPKMLIFEPRKLSKITALSRGILDGFSRKLGEYQEGVR